MIKIIVVTFLLTVTVFSQPSQKMLSLARLFVTGCNYGSSRYRKKQRGAD